MSKVTVISNIMGTGKTEYLISQFKKEENENKSYLWVCPYLDEIERVKQSTWRPWKYLDEPQERGEGKLTELKKLLNGSDDVCTTHALFLKFDDECKQAIEGRHYTLIIDEVLDAVQKFEFKRKGDIKFLLEQKQIEISDDGLVTWIGYSDLDTSLDYIKDVVQNGCLYRMKEEYYICIFSPQIFDLFDEVIISTFLFEGSIMKYYFDAFNIEYELKSISKTDKNTLVDIYEPDKEAFRNRFVIYNDGKDDFFKKDTSLSKTWFNNHRSDKLVKQLKNNIYNFVRNVCNVKSSSILWTTYESAQKLIEGDGFKRAFLECNARATNKYKDRNVLVYALNYYLPPEITNFFEHKGVEVDKDKIALAMMLQWIWRSAIRVNCESRVYIYIPSARMKKLFTDWLDL